MITKIGVIGQQCAGKTTAAKFISEMFDTTITVKFADPIYGTLKAFREEKNRAFMQELGDVAKKYFGELVFVENFMKSVKDIEKHLVLKKSGIRESKHLIICDDIRFSYEFDVAKELGFKIISIDTVTEIRKARAEQQGLDFIGSHNSETEIPVLIFKADLTIIDKGITKDDLRRYIRQGVSMEIDPHYCDVIIQRWENFTGNKIKKLTNAKRKNRAKKIRQAA